MNKLGLLAFVALYSLVFSSSIVLSDTISCEAWIDPDHGSDYGAGNLENPFRSIAAPIARWTQNQPLACTRLSIQLSPSFYNERDIVFMIPIDIWIGTCSECPHFGYHRSKAAFNTSTNTSVLVFEIPNNRAVLSNITFEGSGDMSTANVLVASTNLRLEHVEVHQFYGSQSFLRFHNPSLNYYGSIELSHCTFKDSVLVDQRSITAPSLVEAQQVKLISVQDSSFLNTTLSLIHLNIGNAIPRGGPVVYAKYYNSLDMQRTRVEGTRIGPLLVEEATPSIQGSLSLQFGKVTTITDCVFTRNKIPFIDLQVASFGAALSFLNPLSVLISNSLFLDNQAHNGAAIYLYSNPKTLSKDGSSIIARIENSRFEDNVCSISGCAIFMLIESRLASDSLDNSLFVASSRFSNNSLNSIFTVSIPITQSTAQYYRRFGASAIWVETAMMDDTPITSSTKLFIQDSSFFRHSVYHSPLYQGFPGGVLVARGVQTASISRSNFTDTLDYASSSAVVTIRDFQTLVFSGCFALNNSRSHLQVSSPSSFDKLNATSTPESQQCLGLAQYNSSSDRLLPFYTATIIKNCFESISRHQDSDIVVTAIPSLLFAFNIVASPETGDIASSLGPMPDVAITQVSVVEIADSAFGHPLSLHGNAYHIIRNSNFSLMHGSAVSISDSSRACIIGSRWLQNVASFDGAAIHAKLTVIDIVGSEFIGNFAGNRGAVVTDSALFIYGTTFLRNSASYTGGAVWTSSYVSIFNCTFSLNRAFHGGALSLGAGHSTIVNTTFTGNTARGYGGGVLMFFQNGSLTVDNCVFKGNTAESGGAAVDLSSSVLEHRFQRTNFSWNTATAQEGHTLYTLPTYPSDWGNTFITESGGAIRSFKQEDASLAPIWIIECRFDENRASYGGDLSLLSGSFYIEDSHFQNSYATHWGSRIVLGPLLPKQESHIIRTTFTNTSGTFDSFEPAGGAIFRFGSVYTIPDQVTGSVSITRIENTVFDRVYARYGGAIYQAGGEPSFAISNCSFSHLRASKGPVLFYGYNHDNSTRNDPVIPSVCTDNCDFVDDGLVPNLAESTGYTLEAILYGNLTEYRGDVVTLSVFLKDLYGVVPSHSDGLYSVQLELSDGLLLSTKIDLENLDLVGRTSIPFLILFDSRYAWTSSPIYAKRPAENPMDRIHNTTLTLSIPAEHPFYTRFYKANFTIPIQIGSCAPGMGLTSHPLIPHAFWCRNCSAGSYNLNGDGQCYLCNDPDLNMDKASCFNDQVLGTAGFFATPADLASPSFTSDLPSRGRSNKIWIHHCLFGYCIDGGCSSRGSGRDGFLCADCPSNSMQSVVFSECGLCTGNVRISFIVFIATCIFAYLILIHVSASLNFGLTLIACHFAQQSLLFPNQFIPTVLPHYLSIRVASWSCLAEANAIDRATIFAPLASILVLPVSYVVMIMGFVAPMGLLFIFRKVKRKLKNELSSSSEQDSFHSSLPTWLSFPRIHLTLWLLMLISITPVLQTLIEFGVCFDTPNGKLWHVAPSVKCDSKEFLHRKTVSFALGIPFLLASLTYVLYRTFTPDQILRTSFSTSFRATWIGRRWILLLLAQTSLVGTFSSLGYLERGIMENGTPLLLIAFATLISAAKPFRSSLLGVIATTATIISACLALAPSQLMNHPEGPWGLIQFSSVLIVSALIWASVFLIHYFVTLDTPKEFAYSPLGQSLNAGEQLDEEVQEE